MPEGTRRDVKLLPSAGRVTHQFFRSTEFFGSKAMSQGVPDGVPPHSLVLLLCEHDPRAGPVCPAAEAGVVLNGTLLSVIERGNRQLLLNRLNNP